MAERDGDSRTMEAENLWRMRGQHPHHCPVSQYSCGALPNAVWERSRETPYLKLSEALTDSGPALTRRHSVIWGKGDCEENRPSWAQCCSMWATQKLFLKGNRGETGDSTLGRDRGLACTCVQVQQLC